MQNKPTFHDGVKLPVISSNQHQQHPQAEIEGDRQLFAEILPHLTFFLDVTKHCGFMSEELKDSMPMGNRETHIYGILEHTGSVEHVATPHSCRQTFVSLDLLRMFHVNEAT